MLRRLSADDDRFKTLEFRDGLNLVVAKSTSDSSATDSRNGTGKSSTIELLHFLLGARADRRHLVARKELRRIVFSLDMDWPTLTGPLVISRSGSNPQSVTLNPGLLPDGGASGDGRISRLGRATEKSPTTHQEEFHFPYAVPGSQRQGKTLASPRTVPVTDWQHMIERQLFGLRGEYPGVSGRTLLSFLIRKVGDHGFNEATRTFARQPEAQATPNLAYLLGLDSTLAAKYQDIAARRATRDQLKKVVDDPVWGKVVGRASDLRGEIAVQRSKISDLERQMNSFRVVPQYEALKIRADELARRIQQLHTEDAIDQRNLDHLERAVAEAIDPEVRYLEPVYQELGIALPDQTLRRFEDVRDFHSAVVQNRRIYLEEEIESTRAALEHRKTERARLGEEQSFLLRELSEGGALEALTTLQKAFAQEEATLGALENRLAAAQTVESTSREIDSARIELARQVDQDLNERQPRINEASVLFNKLVSELYGEDRPAYLAVEAGRSSLKITPKINSDDSQGINRMLIFCFDFTLALIAHRAGRGPDFLVHDSHMFDGVDDRQLTRALEMAAARTEAENMQYIVTLNDDDLSKARNLGFEPDPYIVPPILTDEYVEGGLFGFRFG